MKRIEVRWSDAAHHGAGSWVERPIDPRAYVRSVGYLLDKTPTHLVLAQSRMGESYTGVFSIPRSAVRSVKQL
jgi:hypothetical protein